MAKKAKGIEDFEFVRTLGRGGFGTVYLVEMGGYPLALKEIDLTQANKKERENAANECKVLKLLSHEHVITYVDSVFLDGFLYIITDYCDGGDMAMFLNKLRKPVPEDLLRCWLYQMACALEYMHMDQPVILHRDLKPSNIYLSKNGDIQLGDLGIAKVLEHPNMLASTFCGTPCYMSPEMLQEKPYSSKTDIWSLGCCLVEMATEEKAFNGTSLITLMQIILNHEAKPLPPKVYSQEVSDLVTWMMSQDPDERPSATDILNDRLLEETLRVGKTPRDLLTSRGLLRFIDGQPSDPDVRCGTPELRTMSSLAEVIPVDVISDFHDRKNGRIAGRREEQTIRYDPSVTGTWKNKRKHSKKDFSAMFESSSSSSDETTVVSTSTLSQSTLSDSLMTNVVQTLNSTIQNSAASRVSNTSLDSSLASQMQLMMTLAETSLGTESFGAALQSLSSLQDPHLTLGTLRGLMGDKFESLIPVVFILALSMSLRSQPH